MHIESIISVSDLTKTFTLSKKQQKLQKTTEKKKVAVNHLSFEVQKGEVFGLLGPNGAGKTTTLRMMSSLIKPDAGAISINGVDAVKEPKEIRKQIGFLTSELKLEGFFTPEYLCKFCSDLYGVPAEVQQERKNILFEKFGIDQFA